MNEKALKQSSHLVYKLDNDELKDVIETLDLRRKFLEINKTGERQRYEPDQCISQDIPGHDFDPR
jgi:hypothetical protein